MTTLADLEARLASLEARLADPRQWSLDELAVRFAHLPEVQAEAARTLLPWQEVNPSVLARTSLDGATKAVLLADRDVVHLRVEEAGTLWRVPLRLSWTEARLFANLVLRAAGYRLEGE